MRMRPLPLAGRYETCGGDLDLMYKLRYVTILSLQCLYEICVVTLDLTETVGILHKYTLHVNTIEELYIEGNDPRRK